MMNWMIHPSTSWENRDLGSNRSNEKIIDKDIIRNGLLGKEWEENKAKQETRNTGQKKYCYIHMVRLLCWFFCLL
jgi:hypothetical protein